MSHIRELVAQALAEAAQRAHLLGDGPFQADSIPEKLSQTPEASFRQISDITATLARSGENKPAEEGFGEISCSWPLRLKKLTSKSPMRIAQSLLDNLPASSYWQALPIKPPGFLNLTFTAQAYAFILSEALQLPPLKQSFPLPRRQGLAFDDNLAFIRLEQLRQARLRLQIPLGPLPQSFAPDSPEEVCLLQDLEEALSCLKSSSKSHNSQSPAKKTAQQIRSKLVNHFHIYFNKARLLSGNLEVLGRRAVLCEAVNALLLHLATDPPKEGIVMSSPSCGCESAAYLQPLCLTVDQLSEVRDLFAQRLQEGLSADGQEIKALPTFLTPPQPGCSGAAIVVDTGGTNMRAALVEMAPDGKVTILAGPVKDKVPTGREGCPVSSEEFFNAQAKLALSLNPPPDLPLGYCFSYPAASTPECDARLINWTKGVCVSDVEGQLVGQGLRLAMKRLGYSVKSVTVLNDTVAALLAGAGSQAGQYDNYIGLIAGTGFNIALFAPVKAHNKLGALNFQSEQMALNLEAGNFTPSHLSKWDEALDKVMPPLHGQRLEKAIAGFYLPYIYEAVCPQATDFDPALGTGQLVHLRDHGDSLAAQVILERSSALLAAVLAGALKVTAARNCCIIAEGTRYWADPLQDKQVRRYLKELIPSELNFDIIKIADANLIGSACAALR